MLRNNSQLRSVRALGIGTAVAVLLATGCIPYFEGQRSSISGLEDEGIADTTLADIDGDGLDEPVVLTDTRVVRFTTCGTTCMTQAEAVPFSNDRLFPRMATGDYDSDGFDDVAIGHRDGGVQVYFGAASGLDATRQIRFDSANALGRTEQPDGIFTGDFNGDGIDDIGVEDDTDLKYHLSAGDRSFGPTQLIDSRQGNDVLRIGPAVGDFDGDGDHDLAYLNRSRLTSELEFALTDLPTLEQAPFQFSLAAGDLDGDGIDDLLGAAELQNTPNPFAPYEIRFLRSTGTSLEPFATNPVFPTVGSPFHLLVEDLNGDGAADLLAQDSGDAIKIWAGDPDAAIPLTTGAPRTDTNIQSSAVAAGDTNGDGFMELLAWTLREEIVIFSGTPGGGASS